MELQELQEVWDNYDHKIEDSIKIDYQFLKKISLEKTKSLLFQGKLSALLEATINILFLSPILNFGFNHIAELKYSIPSLLLALIMVLTIAWNLYGFILLNTVNYYSPIIAIQRRLAKYKMQNLFRQQELLYVLYPLSQTLFLIIFCKGALSLDLYNSPLFLTIQFIAAICIVPFISWIVKISPDKKMDAALNFLNEIRKFEKEE